MTYVSFVGHNIRDYNLQNYNETLSYWYSWLKSSRWIRSSFRLSISSASFEEFRRDKEERREGKSRAFLSFSLSSRKRQGEKEKNEISRRRDERASDVWTPTRAVLITLDRPVLRLCRLEEPNRRTIGPRLLLWAALKSN